MRVASFFFALEHMGGFGGVADRLNAYNVFRGDPVADHVRCTNGFESVAAAELRTMSRRRISSTGPGSTCRSSAEANAGQAPLDRARCPRLRAPSRYRPPVAVSDRALTAEFRSGSFRAAICRPWPARSSSRRGRACSSQAQAGLAQLTTVMLDEGTTSRSAEEIALAVESMGATIGASCGWDGSYVSFRCLEGESPQVLDLTVDILLNPTFPEAEWGRVRGQTLAALRAERDNAESRAYRAILASDLRRRPSLPISAGWHRSDRGGLQSGSTGRVPRAIPRAWPRGDRRCRRRRPGGLADLALPAAAAIDGKRTGIPGGRPADKAVQPPVAAPRPARGAAGGGARRPSRDRSLRPRVRAHRGLEPDLGRSILVSAQREAARGAGVHLRRTQPFRLPRAGGSIFRQHVGPGRPARRRLDRYPSRARRTDERSASQSSRAR